MARVTARLQVTVPRAIAVQYGIDPGDEVTIEPAGDAVRLVPARQSASRVAAERLRLFDESTARQRARDRKTKARTPSAPTRGWSREDLYQRGRAR